MKKRTMIGIISIVAAVIVATILIIFNVILSAQMVTAYVSTQKLSEGQQITEELLETVEVHKSDLNGINLISEPEEIVGKFATVDIATGDFITTNKISAVATSTDNQFLSIPSGKQAISFSVKGGADSLSNKLAIGDIIRIYSYSNSGGVVSPNELKYVQVASITNSEYQDITDEKKEDDESSAYSTITVIVYTKQVEQLIKIQNEGGVYVTLISRGNDEVANQLLKEQENLLGGEN